MIAADVRPGDLLTLTTADGPATYRVASVEAGCSGARTLNLEYGGRWVGAVHYWDDLDVVASRPADLE